MSLFRWHSLGHVHCHPGMTMVLAGLPLSLFLISVKLSVSFGMTLSPEAPLIARWLLFSTMSWGMNCSAVWSNKIWTEAVFEVSLWGLFWPPLSSLFPAVQLVALNEEELLLSKWPLGLNFPTLFQINVSSFGEYFGALFPYGLPLSLGKVIQPLFWVLGRTAASGFLDLLLSLWNLCPTSELGWGLLQPQYCLLWVGQSPIYG